MREPLPQITVIRGDGIGPEVIDEALRVLDAVGFRVTYTDADAGFECYQRCGSPIPEKTIDAVRGSQACLFGAVTTPSGKEDYPSAIVTLRQRLNLYANIRPFRTYQGLGRYAELPIDIVVFRENTEDLYFGKGWRVGDQAYNLRLISREASERILMRGLQYAKDHRKHVTVVHKANVVKPGDVLFLEVAQAVAARFPGVTCQTEIVDALCMKLVLNPERYQVIIAPNLYGDIISDLLAGIVGGLGLCPSANLGDQIGLFEPVHGSAPDIAGKGVANPIAAILSAAMLLDHLGERAKAERVRRAVEGALRGPTRTPDLGGTATTKQMTDAVVEGLSHT